MENIISEESLQTKIHGLAQIVGKDSSKLDYPEAINLIKLDISFLPNEITVSTNDTRKTEVQYCTNTYFGSTRMDVSYYKEHIISTVEPLQEDVSKMIDSYVEMKQNFVNFIKYKYSSMEANLREMSREAQKKDRVVGVGRYGEA